MKQHLKRIFEAMDRFIKNYQRGRQSKYIRLRSEDYKLAVNSLPYFQRLQAEKKGHFEYRGFTVIPEKP
ncbi:MAG: hypothetical protein REH83_04370 [Rickettsiella sp.]|nr:hypothetical protein [Rickettsiella sp.]